MTTYIVDNGQMRDYIIGLDKRRTRVFILLTLLILLSQVFIVDNLESNFPFWIFFIITIAISLTFYISLRHVNNKLNHLSNSQYFIDQSSIKHVASCGEAKEFKLYQIAVIHKKHSGTLIVKGNGWTKVNYIRPKRANPYQIGERDVIFIPTITSNYEGLIRDLKQKAPNAMKI